jgi:transposase-like protein
MSTTRHTDTVEVILKGQRRRRWSPAEKAALVRRTDEPGMSVSLAQVSAPRRCGGQLVVPVENA